MLGDEERCGSSYRELKSFKTMDRRDNSIFKPSILLTRSSVHRTTVITYSW